MTTELNTANFQVWPSYATALLRYFHSRPGAYLSVSEAALGSGLSASETEAAIAHLEQAGWLVRSDVQGVFRWQVCIKVDTSDDAEQRRAFLHLRLVALIRRQERA